MQKSDEVSAGLWGLDYKTHANGCMAWERQMGRNIKMREGLYDSLISADVVIYGFSAQPISLSIIDVFKNEVLPNKVFITEIDDFIYGVPNYNPAFKNGLKPGNGLENIVSLQMTDSNAVITSTDYLKKEYAVYNQNINVVPNSVDLQKWNFARKKNKKIRIGWIGAANHDEDLRLLEPVIPAILEKYKNVEFSFVHGVPDFLKKMGKRVKFSHTDKWCDIRKYPKFMASQNIDIGLAPLLDNRFNRCKSNLRWLEYGTQKTPCVASNVADFSKTIKDGKTGFLASETKDWIDKISLLVENETLRQEVGNNAYNLVEKDYNIKTNTEKYIKIIKGVYNGQRRLEARNEKTNKRHIGRHKSSEMVEHDTEQPIGLGTGGSGLEDIVSTFKDNG